jgi:hypothetical protein
MKTFSHYCCWPALLMMLGPALIANADDVEGVVRLSDLQSSDVVLGQSPEGVVVEEGYCPEGTYVEGPIYYGPPPIMHHSVLSNNCLADCMRGHCMNFRMRNQIASAQLCTSAHISCQEHEHWFRSKFGYFFPTGCCGRGCPPVGHYSVVYPLDPNYFDQRDGNVYAAAGYGGPVSVPLAPNVRYAYNYGWGVPSSRLTPISHPYPGP